MSDEVVIRVENLGKRYRLGAGRSGERYTALRDVIADKTRSLFRARHSSLKQRLLGAARHKLRSSPLEVATWLDDYRAMIQSSEHLFERLDAEEADFAGRQWLGE